MNLREWALPVYTILIQLATGAISVLWIVRFVNRRRIAPAVMDRILLRPVIVIFFTILVAILGSHFHLSNPLLSFMALLNIRSSWLSREVLFTIFLFFSSAALVDSLSGRGIRFSRLSPVLGWAVVLFGLASIFSMSRIYLLPTQAPWNHWTTIGMFFASCLPLGATSAAALLLMDTIFSKDYEPDLALARQALLEHSFRFFAWAAAAGLPIILALNAWQFAVTTTGDMLERTSLLLLLSLYRPLLISRFVFLFIATAVFILAIWWKLRRGRKLAELVTPVYLACWLALISEILGRFLFYASHVRLGI